jgi:hypothetical protein
MAALEDWRLDTIQYVGRNNQRALRRMLSFNAENIIRTLPNPIKRIYALPYILMKI